MIVKYLFTDLAGIIRGVEKNVDDPFSSKAYFDASSVRGFEKIEDSDLMLKCTDNLYSSPFRSDLKYCLSDIYTHEGREYVKDPRGTAKKIRLLLEDMGLQARLGVEIEFFLVKNIRARISLSGQEVSIGIVETPDAGGTIPVKKGYFLVEPHDWVRNARLDIVHYMELLGFKPVKSHHEVATTGQVEITSPALDPVLLGDYTVLFKIIARETAKLHGLEAVFLPKPFPIDNGSGMHIHISLWRDTENVFRDPSGEYGLSSTALYFIGGILEHGRSLSAIVSPTVNSYRRLVPGYEAPTLLAWGPGNRSTAIRIPRNNNNGSFRIEYRPSDPLANPYLAYTAILLAGLDGIRKKIMPPPPLLKNAYKLSAEEIRELGLKTLPRSLWEALDELESDHEYLHPVFPKELIESYIDIKRDECMRLQPVPSTAEYVEYLMY
ncbi:MAG: type I glutamate--ammonia ligase [Crenarchaeota archaeon]|nr:type I glutamate--ammonia ligase [Thermoproteota archaeon]